MHRALIIALAAVAALLCAERTARADARTEAMRAMKTGARHFEKGEYEKAIVFYRTARGLVPEAPGPYRELGKCYHKMGAYEEAIRHYEEYLGRSPAAADRAEIATGLEEARAALAARRAAEKGRLRIETAPPGAAVRLDRRDAPPAGLSPVTLDLPAGPHTAFVALAGYEEEERAVEIKVGMESVLSLPLRRSGAGMAPPGGEAGSGAVEPDRMGRPPFYATWWFWTVVGVVVGGAVAGGVVGALSGPSVGRGELPDF